MKVLIGAGIGAGAGLIPLVLMITYASLIDAPGGYDRERYQVIFLLENLGLLIAVGCGAVVGAIARATRAILSRLSEVGAESPRNQPRPERVAGLAR